MWKSVMDLINLDGYIDFASQLITKYPWKKQTRRELGHILSLIKSKQEDKCINLSVIGEFNSGKSSFINAILKEELLVSSSIQGTTVVNTVIEYDEQYALTIIYNDGSKKRHEFRHINDLRGRLSNLTTNPKNAREIAYVYVDLPSPSLKKGIRIIDTPGTNSTESWHEEVTKRALHELSDLSIILTDATKPLPKTLINFLNENLSALFRQCALAVTRIDLVSEEERDEVMDYIRGRAESELETEDFLVLPFAAPAVIGEMTNTQLVENQKQMAEICETNAQLLFSHSVEMRKTAQVKKLLSLINDAYDALKSSMGSKIEQCDEELAILEKSKNAPLDGFINKRKKDQKTSFGSIILKIRDQLIMDLENQIDETKNTLISGIREAKAENLDQFSRFMTEDFPRLCSQENDRLNGITKNASNRLQDLLVQAIRQFQKDFQREFQRLGLLQMNMGNQNLPATEFTIVLSSFLDDIVKSVNETSAENESNENNMVKGGAVAGFAFGGFVGAIVGGIGGYILGKLIRKSVDDVKGEVVIKLTNKLEELTKAAEEAVNSFDNASDEICNIYEGELNRYLKTYRAVVNKKIEQNKKRQIELNREKRNINRDLRLIDTHKEQLLSVISKIN